jgi:hypothetical protein
MISEPGVRSVQTVHLSSIKISTISKWNESCFRLSLLTTEYHRVPPKWFLSLWYVWRKPCTCLAPTLTQFPNRAERDSTWPSSPRSSIRCVQNYFSKPMVCSARSIHLSWVRISTISQRGISTWPTSHRSCIWCIQNDFQAKGMLGTKHSPILH